MPVSALEKASAGDRGEIAALVRAVVERLNQSGIPQWDEAYPNESHVDEDIRKGQLYLVRAGGGIAGILTLNRDSDPQYRNADWEYSGPDFMVAHRLCVSPDLQGRGIAGSMMRMAEAMLSAGGVKSLRLDAFSGNPHALKLYQSLGYRVAGEAVWRKGLFYLMEKSIATP